MKLENIREVSKNYSLGTSLPAKIKILSILAKNSRKQKLNFSCSALFHMKTMIHTLLYRCFQICSDWTKCYLKLAKLIYLFKSNGFSENLINGRFKTFLDNKHRIEEKW